MPSGTERRALALQCSRPADLGAVADDDVLGADVHVAADGAVMVTVLAAALESRPTVPFTVMLMTCGEHVALRRAAHADAVAREERVVLPPCRRASPHSQRP